MTNQSLIMSAAPPSPRQRRKDARPQELLDAALALFVEKGFAATRSEEVAARAGVSKGTLYLYFPSKEELLKAVIRQTLSADIAAGARLLETLDGTATHMLTEVLTRWWVDMFLSPGSGVFKLVITEMCNFPELAKFYADEVILPGTTIIRQLIQRGIDSGEFRDVDQMSTAHSIIMPMVMMCLHRHSLGACGFAEPVLADPEHFVRHHLALIFEGLRQRPDSPAPSERGPAP
jgi:AcrR family transcriptional regulator